MRAALNESIVGGAPFAGGRQRHLSRSDAVNLGAYYTGPAEVRTVWEMLAGRVPERATILDSACGYGSFLRDKKTDIGCDIDEEAVARARQRRPRATIFHANALSEVSRKKFNIAEDAPLVVVGNPPFNDKTSHIRRDVKAAAAMETDADIKARDLGFSFLRSFDKLRADLVCVLHPLSYLIKPVNFARLGGFAKNYALISAKIFSSARFPDNSQSMPFPVVAALYKRDASGMRHDDIRRFRFAVGGRDFAVDDFQYIGGLLRKYPRPPGERDLDGVMFFPLRDINALRRNRTFLFRPAASGVFIDRKQLEYYIYADVFKQFAQHVPYYLGNSDIIIDGAMFQERKRHFINNALHRHAPLRHHVRASATTAGGLSAEKIREYFRFLLGEHYEN